MSVFSHSVVSPAGAVSRRSRFRVTGGAGQVIGQFYENEWQRCLDPPDSVTAVVLRRGKVPSAGAVSFLVQAVAVGISSVRVRLPSIGLHLLDRARRKTLQRRTFLVYECRQDFPPLQPDSGTVETIRK